MYVLSDNASPRRRAGTLLILLPGAWQTPEDFLAQGFVAALRERGSDVDVRLPALETHRLDRHTALARLDATVVRPARSAGYDRFWLAGISLGGLLALDAAERGLMPLAGVSLLAPYPGNRLLTREIADAGGAVRWRALDDEDKNNDDDERRVWRWLGSQPALPLHLGFGREDRFADGLELMADTLPATHVDRVAGGHDWPAWNRLWPRMLSTLEDTPC